MINKKKAANPTLHMYIFNTGGHPFQSYLLLPSTSTTIKGEILIETGLFLCKIFPPVTFQALEIVLLEKEKVKLEKQI